MIGKKVATVGHQVKSYIWVFPESSLHYSTVLTSRCTVKKKVQQRAWGQDKENQSFLLLPVLFIWQPLIVEEDMKMEKRKNNSLLLRRKTRLREEMLISDWVLREHFPATEFTLSFYVLSRGSFFNCLLSLRVNFRLSGQNTPYMPLFLALLSLSSSR